MILSPQEISEITIGETGTATGSFGALATMKLEEQPLPDYLVEIRLLLKVGARLDMAIMQTTTLTLS